MKSDCMGSLAGVSRIRVLANELAQSGSSSRLAHAVPHFGIDHPHLLHDGWAANNVRSVIDHFFEQRHISFRRQTLFVKHYMPALSAHRPALLLSKLVHRFFERGVDARPAHARQQHLERVHLRGEVQLEVGLLLLRFARLGLDLNLLDAGLEDILVLWNHVRLSAPSLILVQGYIRADESTLLVIGGNAAAQHLSRLARPALKNKRALMIVAGMRDLLEERRYGGLIHAQNLMDRLSHQALIARVAHQVHELLIDKYDPPFGVGED